MYPTALVLFRRFCGIHYVRGAMGSKLSPPDEELYRRTDEVLHYLWDPIGVAGEPMARDEYYSYLPHVFSLLKADAGAEKIAAYLSQVASEQMGLASNQEHAFVVANTLLAWKETILANHP